MNRARYLIAATAVALLLAGAVVLVVRADRQRERESAITLALGGGIDRAAPALKRAIARDPEDVEAVRALALGHLRAGQLAESEEYLRRWSELAPADDEPSRARIEWALKTNRLEAAIEPADTILTRDPADADLRRQLVTWLFLTGHTERAGEEAARCRDDRPDDLGLIDLQGEIAHRLGEYDLAAGFADEALARVPYHPPALLLKGIVEFESGRPDGAIPPLQKAMERDPRTTLKARHFLGLALAELGRTEEADRLFAENQRDETLRIWEKYGRLDRPAYLVEIARSFLDAGQVTEGVALLKGVLSRDPDCADAHRVLAEHYEREGDQELADRHRAESSPN